MPDIRAFQKNGAARVVQQPCRHLSPICVAPSARGKACCPETQSAQNVPFYGGCGFWKILRTPVPGTDMSYWGMLRKP